MLANPLPSPFQTEGTTRRYLQAYFPRTLAGPVWRISAWNQFWLCLISLALSLLDTAPTEIRRRIFQ